MKASHRRTSSDSIPRHANLNDTDNKKSGSSLSKSQDRSRSEKSLRANQVSSNSSANAEDKFVYQRIEHKGLPRIPVEGKSPYEILQAVSKGMDNAPESASVYVDRDSQGNAYIFFVRPSEEKQDKKLNARYYRQELTTVLGNMADFVATPEAGAQVPVADIMNLQALAKRPAESGDITVGELRQTVKNLNEHMKRNRVQHLRERHAVKDTLAFTINRLNEFCAISKTDLESLSKDLCQQHAWLDKTLAASMFTEAIEAAADIISELEETQKLDVIKLRTLPGFDKFIAFSKLWGEFQKAGTDPKNFNVANNDFIANLSPTSMAAIAGWGKEIAKLNSLISDSGKNSTDKAQAAQQASGTDTRTETLNDKLRALALKNSGNSSLKRVASLSSDQPAITPRTALTESHNEKRLRALISRNTISSPRIKTDSEKVPVNPLSESEDQKMATYFSSPALRKDLSDEDSHPVGTPEAPRKQPVRLVWRRSEGTPDHSSVSGTDSADQRNAGSGSGLSSVMSPGSAREAAANDILQGLLGDLQPEVFPAPEDLLASASTQHPDSPENPRDDKVQSSQWTVSGGSSGSVTTSWASEMREQSLLSPRDSQWMDEEIFNLTSPGKPMFEVGDNGNFSEFPMSPTTDEKQ